MTNPAIFWFRRDLRLEDNRGLTAAMASGQRLIPLFIFDTGILEGLPKDDARVTFIHRTLQGLAGKIRGRGGDLWVAHGKPVECLEALLQKTGATAIFANKDFEPEAVARDRAVGRLCEQRAVTFETHLDHLLLDPRKGLKEDGTPYTVYTPYSRKFLAQLSPSVLDEAVVKDFRWHPGRAAKGWSLPTLSELRFKESLIKCPPVELNESSAKGYEKTRNFMGLEDGTTRWGVHLRFGTLGIRSAFRFALKTSEVLTGELIWREFFAQVMAHFPEALKQPFRSFGRHMTLRDSPADFKAWAEGRTGYPVVDAGMRELQATGHMHNRVRMVTASFLSKHLLLDYRLGEAHFARHLLDFERASNNGNWQWAAGTGTDAAPYFRIFNPAAQAAKFDPTGEYVRKWVPEVGTPSYPEPMVDHVMARNRALAAYERARATEAGVPIPHKTARKRAP